jgi:hypothetical protein
MNRKTLIAGGVFALLVIVAVVVQRAPDKGERSGEAPRPVPAIAAGEVDTLEITKAGAKTVVKKEGATFKVTAPAPYAADQDGAKQAFEAIEKLEFGNIVTDQKAKHDEYEVGANAVRVVAKKGDKVLADLHVGKVTNNATLVRPEGKDEVWQAIGALKYTFDKGPADWRDKTILSFDEGDAERLEVVSKAGGKIVLKKPAKGDGGAADGEWAVVESSAKVDPLDKTIAPGMISALYAWKANDFADAAKPEETGLDAPELTVTVGLKGDKKKTILVGKKKGEEDYFVKTADGPQVFLVKKYNLERINKRPVDFRDKTICNLNEGEIVDVSVNRDKESYTLVKDAKKSGDEAWKLAKPAGTALDATKVNAITSAFRDWKGTGFAEESTPKATGLDKPTATINARTAAKGTACVLRVGAETSDKQGYYVEKPGTPEIFVVPKWSLDRVLVKVEDLKKKSGS